MASASFQTRFYASWMPEFIPKAAQHVYSLVSPALRTYTETGFGRTSPRRYAMSAIAH